MLLVVIITLANIIVIITVNRMLIIFVSMLVVDIGFDITVVFVVGAVVLVITGIHIPSTIRSLIEFVTSLSFCVLLFCFSRWHHAYYCHC